jgi:hypothetical protein
MNYQHSVIILLAFILIIQTAGCGKKVENPDGTGGTREETDRIEPIEPVPGDPEDPGAVGKKVVVIGNKADENAAKPKKDSKGYQQEGTWSQSVLSGFKNSISRYSSDPSAKVTYETDKIGTGPYCVSIYRVTAGNSIDFANIQIKDDESELTSKRVAYNYHTSRAGWHHLGVFNFSSKVGKVVLMRGTPSNSGYLRADEVRFKKVKEGSDCFGKLYQNIVKGGVIDNKKDENNLSGTKKDSTGYRQYGEWIQSVHAGHKNSISRFANDPASYVVYRASVAAKEYCLSYYRVTHPDSVSAATFTVANNGSVVDTVNVNFALAVAEKGWMNLGTYNFNEGDKVEVRLNRNEGVIGYLRADALRFKSQFQNCL